MVYASAWPKGPKQLRVYNMLFCLESPGRCVTRRRRSVVTIHRTGLDLFHAFHGLVVGQRGNRGVRLNRLRPAPSRFVFEAS